MKPKLLLLVVPFVVAGMLQGCFAGLCLSDKKDDTNPYKPTEEPLCGGYEGPIVLGALSILAGVGAGYTFGVVAPSESDTCEEILCTSQRTKMNILGVLISLVAAGFLTGTIITLFSAIECSDRKIKYEVYISELTTAEFKKLGTDLKRERYMERCEKLNNRAIKNPTGSTAKEFYKECREFIRMRTNTTDIHGRTKLHRAVKQASKSDTKKYIFWGADVNAKDKYGWTPLHYAASIGSKDIVEMLQKKGADPKAKDNEGKTPLDIAVEKGHEVVVELLRNAAGGGR